MSRARPSVFLRRQLVIVSITEHLNQSVPEGAFAHVSGTALDTEMQNWNTPECFSQMMSNLVQRKLIIIIIHPFRYVNLLLI